ncbi:MAG: HD domain-containing protein [Desulfuromonadaceae bacterium]
MTAIIPILKSLFPPSCHERIFLVGGTLRDMLSGREGQDIDLVTSLSADELTRLGFRHVEATSGSAIYFRYHPEFGKIEATRIDSRHDLEADLHRRDFTVNAMAMDLSGRVIDPLGGADDVRGRVLRACSGNAFTDDALRIFRAFRFETDGWRMAAGTASLIRAREWSAAFAAMPVERFSAEMLKALPLKAPERFFQLMLEFRVGAEFLPEIFRMPQVPAGPLQHHPEGDLLVHSIQVLQRVAAETNEPLPRFCALFHDLGKLATDPALYPTHHGHDNTGFAMAVEFCNRLRLPATYRTALAWVSSLHGKANKWHELRDSSKLKMAEQAFRGGIVHILPLIAAADKAGGLPMTGWEDVVRIAVMSARELGIDQESLEAMPVKNRAAFILQKRVEMLKKQS